MILTNANQVYKIIDPKDGRFKLLIGSHTVGNLYLMTYEDKDRELYTDNGWRIEDKGLLDLDNYDGPIYGVSDVGNHEVRILEAVRCLVIK